MAAAAVVAATASATLTAIATLPDAPTAVAAVEAPAAVDAPAAAGAETALRVAAGAEKPGTAAASPWATWRRGASAMMLANSAMCDSLRCPARQRLHFFR